MSQLNWFNQLPEDCVKMKLRQCCGAESWVVQMSNRRPFSTLDALYFASEAVWNNLDSKDWLEAFSHHPRIGEKIRTLNWSSQEQKVVEKSNESVLRELAEWNQKYEEKFGHVFLVCATGKSTEEMLTLLKERFRNGSCEELRIAVGEHVKITRIRLGKFLEL